jgi:hypothetical protein
MKSMRNWMLAAAVVAGGLALGATNAQAAEYRGHFRGPVVYAQHRPEPGYGWGAGRWNDAGGRDRGVVVRGEVGFGRDRDRDRDSNRRGDRDHFRR